MPGSKKISCDNVQELDISRTLDILKKPSDNVQESDRLKALATLKESCDNAQKLGRSRTSASLKEAEDELNQLARLLTDDFHPKPEDIMCPIDTAPLHEKLSKMLADELLKIERSLSEPEGSVSPPKTLTETYDGNVALAGLNHTDDVEETAADSR